MTDSVFKRTAPVTRINPLSLESGAGESDAIPATEIPFSFAQQSLLVSSVAQYAILPQPLSAKSRIIASTLDTSQHDGYALALSSDAECPVTVQFQGGTGGQKTASGAVTLAPGQIVRPTGMANARGGGFTGFQYGLPWGWLGGGNGRLIVFKSHDSYLRYIAHSGTEILFHQEALTILAADAAVPANWPYRFPWSEAKSQVDATGVATAAAVAQGGPGQLIVTPTRTVFEIVCHGAGLAAPDSVIPYIHKDGAAIGMVDAAINFAAVAVGSNASQQVVGGVLNRLAADKTYVTFVSASLANLVLNIYRYGTLG